MNTLKENDELCDLCLKPAVWFYIPGSEQYCDDCVPRGCSCNEFPLDGNPENTNPENWEEEVDEKGRKLPCCEFLFVDN